MKMATLGTPSLSTRRPAHRCTGRGHLRMVLLAFGLLTVSSRPAHSQGSSAGGAWTLPDPTDLVARAIRRIITQDKPGGLPIEDFPHRAFGREETAAAVRGYLGRTGALSAEAFGAVQAWPTARGSDSLPCAQVAGLTPVLATAPPPSAATDRCANPNALWLAITRIERGPLPHELHLWYATHFRTDTQGVVQESTYSFCERWLRVGGTWKYDGFVRVSRGVVAP